MPAHRAAHLLAVLAVDLAAQAAVGVAPSVMRLLPAGRFRAADGSGRPAEVAAGWLIDAQIAAALIAAANARAGDYVIDYEHQTINAAKNGQPAPAAGWFKRLEWRPGDGLYAVDVRWTEKAILHIRAGEYRYLSPVFAYDSDGRVLALGPAALTNNPGLDGLTDLSTAAMAAYFHQEESPMKELLKALGLAETATEADALAALTALRSQHQAALTAAAMPDMSKYVGIATLQGVQAELSATRSELTALQAERQATEVDKVVTAALAAGKLTPATEAWARDLGKANLAALNAFISAASVVVKPGETQTGGTAPVGVGSTSHSTAADLAVMTAMGLTAEQFAAGKQQGV